MGPTMRALDLLRVQVKPNEAYPKFSQERVDSVSGVNFAKEIHVDSQTPLKAHGLLRTQRVRLSGLDENRR